MCNEICKHIVFNNITKLMNLISIDITNKPVIIQYSNLYKSHIFIRFLMPDILCYIEIRYNTDTEILDTNIKYLSHKLDDGLFITKKIFDNEIIKKQHMLDLFTKGTPLNSKYFISLQYKIKTFIIGNIIDILQYYKRHIDIFLNKNITINNGILNIKDNALNSITSSDIVIISHYTLNGFINDVSPKNITLGSLISDLVSNSIEFNRGEYVKLNAYSGKDFLCTVIVNKDIIRGRWISEINTLGLAVIKFKSRYLIANVGVLAGISNFINNYIISKFNNRYSIYNDGNENKLSYFLNLYELVNNN